MIKNEKRFVSIRADLLEGLLKNKWLTSEDVQVGIAHFIVGGNQAEIQKLTGLNPSLVGFKVSGLKGKGLI